MAPRSSRQRYKGFVEDYKRKRLDEEIEARDRAPDSREGAEPPKPERRRNHRRYLRDYLNWLKPHRYGLALMFGLAIVGGGLEMVEPLFMRFIVDKVLLNKTLTDVARLARLNAAGSLFLGIIIF